MVVRREKRVARALGTNHKKLPKTTAYSKSQIAFIMQIV
jgi:hypothetical protein